MIAVSEKDHKTIISLFLLLAILLLISGGRREAESRQPVVVGKPDPLSEKLLKISVLVNESSEQSCNDVSELVFNTPGVKPLLSDICFMKLASREQKLSFCGRITDADLRSDCRNSILELSESNKVIEARKLENTCRTLKQRRDIEMREWGRLLDHGGKFDEGYKKCGLV